MDIQQTTPQAQIVRYEPVPIQKFGDKYILSTGQIHIEGIAALLASVAATATFGTPVAAAVILLWAGNNVIAAGKLKNAKPAIVTIEDEEYKALEASRNTIDLGGHNVQQQGYATPEALPAYAPEPLEDVWSTPASAPTTPAVVAEPTHPITVDYTPVPTAQPTEAPPVVTEENFIDSWASPVKNSLFVGLGGSGKGYLVSNLMRTTLKKNPNLRVFVIDPKNDADEKGYWQAPELGDRVFHYAETMLGKHPDIIYDWVETGIAKFQAMPCPKLLILDECIFLSGNIKNSSPDLDDNGKAVAGTGGTKKLEQFWFRLLSWASLGDKQGIHAWLMGQNGHVGDYGGSGGILGQFFRVALIKSSDLAFAKTLNTGGLFGGLMPKDETEVGRLCEASECDRAIYDATKNKWRSMPELTNYSAYDRDRRVSIPSNAVPVTAPDSRLATQSSEARTSVAAMKPPVETEFDVSDLLAELEDAEVYEDFDKVMSILKAQPESTQAQLFVKLLELIRELGQGQVFTVDSTFTKHKIFQWAAANVKGVNQSIPKISSLIAQLAKPKYAFVISVDESTWKVNLH